MMGRDQGQKNLFDVRPMIKHKIESGSIYQILHESRDEYIWDEDFAQMYQPIRGRYSRPLSLSSTGWSPRRPANTSPNHSPPIRESTSLRDVHLLFSPKNNIQAPIEEQVKNLTDGQGVDRVTVAGGNESSIATPVEPVKPAGCNLKCAAFQ